jgi:hypothetical protein
MKRRVSLYFSFAALASLAGCGSSGTGGAPDGGERGAAGQASASAGSGGAGGSAAGSTGAGGATACNSLTLSATAPVATARTGAPPAPAGGTISDGTYVMTKVDVYPPDSSLDLLSETIRVTGNQMEIVAGVGTFVNRVTSTFSTVGTKFVASAITCSDPPGATLATMGTLYTATPTTLISFDGDTTVSTFTKQ